MKKARKMPELILQLKKVRDEKDLSNADILDLVLNAGYNSSRSSVQRVFAEGSENVAFRYEETIEPIERALLMKPEPMPLDDVETIQEAQQYVSQIQALQTANEVKQSIMADQDQNIQELDRTVSSQVGEIAKLEKELLKAEERIIRMEEQHARALEAAERRENERVAEYKQQLAENNKQLARGQDALKWWRNIVAMLLFLLVTTFGAIIAFLVIDRNNPNLGYFWMSHKLTAEEIIFVILFSLCALVVTFFILRRKKLVPPTANIPKEQ